MLDKNQQRGLRNIRLSSPCAISGEGRGQGSRQTIRVKLGEEWKGRGPKRTKRMTGPNPLLIRGDDWSVTQICCRDLVRIS